MNNSLKIIVVCHKYDYFLTKICIASIRYYYPDVDLFLLKDAINGFFSTTTLEKYFKVRVLDLGRDKYGLFTTKIHILLSKKLKGNKYLVLDSDIVFIGKVLDYLSKYAAENDFVVSKQTGLKPNSNEFRGSVYDLSWVKSIYHDFTAPGYYFNAGQIIVSPGLIRSSDIKQLFDPKHYPFWTEYGLKHLPCYDQNLLNFLLPVLVKKGRIRIANTSFMYWSELNQIKYKLTLDEVRQAKYPYLIHWARAHKSTNLKAMTRGDILLFFQYHYYKHIPLGIIKFYINYISHSVYYYINRPRNRSLKSSH